MTDDDFAELVDLFRRILELSEANHRHIVALTARLDLNDLAYLDFDVTE